jgi:biofilm protein TabA
MDQKLSKNPYYVQAMDYIKSHDLNELATGHHQIDGEDLYVNIVDSQMKTLEQARYEVHNKYIDIQIPLSKGETFGVKPRSVCKEPAGDFDEVKDIMFFKDPVDQTVNVAAGEIIVFAPDTAHAPLIGEGTIHKAIFKVKVV